LLEDCLVLAFFLNPPFASEFEPAHTWLEQVKKLVKDEPFAHVDFVDALAVCLDLLDNFINVLGDVFF
jgi:hypothetical protein